MSLLSQYSRLCRREFVHIFRNKPSTRTPYNQTLTVRRFSSGVQRLKGLFKLGLTGITVGAVVGTGYTIHKYNQPRQHIINEEITIPSIDKLPQIQPSRKIRYDNINNNHGLKLTLFQYQTCPFCCKVRAFLDFYGISYDIVEVDPVLRQSIKWSPYRKVPILVASVGDEHQPMNDSSMIISALATFFKNPKELRDIVRCYPHITFIDEDGTKKSDIMNKYFLVLGQTSNEKQIRCVYSCHSQSMHDI